MEERVRGKEEEGTSYPPTFWVLTPPIYVEEVADKITVNLHRASSRERIISERKPFSS